MPVIKRFTEGLLGSNTYLVWNDKTGEACVIDVGNPCAPIAEFAAAQKLKVKYIVLTHAHYDHILYIEDFCAAFPEALTAIHPNDDVLMDDPNLNCSVLFGSAHEFRHCDLMLNEGDTLALGEETFTVLHTPGHTEGGICLLGGGYLFSGDTLFYDSFGRTDLGRGDMDTLGDSLHRLFTLPEETIVLPGHGTRTTIGREKRENYFLYM
ncbi:MAG: MBL fold metallo-hydrolase [Clostridia bacterium]|nr:MBL fold metallo-hydrolase [Clostridia bacterium]